MHTLSQRNRTSRTTLPIRQSYHPARVRAPSWPLLRLFSVHHMDCTIISLLVSNHRLRCIRRHRRGLRRAVPISILRTLVSMRPFAYEEVRTNLKPLTPCHTAPPIAYFFISPIHPACPPIQVSSVEDRHNLHPYKTRRQSHSESPTGRDLGRGPSLCIIRVAHKDTSRKRRRRGSFGYDERGRSR